MIPGSTSFIKGDLFPVIENPFRHFYLLRISAGTSGTLGLFPSWSKNMKLVFFVSSVLNNSDFNFYGIFLNIVFT